MSESLKELTLEMREIQDEIEFLATQEIDTQQLEETMESLKKKVLRKVNNIDHIAIGFDITKNRLLNYAKAYEAEAELAKKKAEQMEKQRDRMYQMLAEVGLVDDGKSLKTGQHTYYLGTTTGAVVISEDATLPKEYIKTKIEQVIDKASLRNDLLKGVVIDGVSIEKKKKVMRK